MGNARPALFNWLLSLKMGGDFILRYDDTDPERSRQEFADAIARDMEWLGVTPARVERQSERLERYQEITDKLKADGRLYPCYETPDELERRRKRQLARGLPPIYDRAALKLTDEEIKAFEADGRRPHWRFKLEGKTVSWKDVFRGEQSIDTASLSDPVLIRADGSYLYTLPSVVDDVDMGVTHVVRGEDHVANTGAQIEVFEAIGGQAPEFGHHNLLTEATGEGFSKRKGSLSLSALRETGYEPMAVAIMATILGTGLTVQPYPDMMSLAQAFDPEKVSRAPARFDVKELSNLNTRIVHSMEFDEARERLSDEVESLGPVFWSAVRENVETVSDAEKWTFIVNGPVSGEMDDSDRDYIEAALSNLPADPWSDTAWKEWTGVLKEQTGRKGKGLFMPLRRALTGQSSGPDLGLLLPLIGRSAVEERLRALLS